MSAIELYFIFCIITIHVNITRSKAEFGLSKISGKFDSKIDEFNDKISDNKTSKELYQYKLLRQTLKEILDRHYNISKDTNIRPTFETTLHTVIPHTTVTQEKRSNPVTFTKGFLEQLMASKYEKFADKVVQSTFETIIDNFIPSVKQFKVPVPNILLNDDFYKIVTKDEEPDKSPMTFEDSTENSIQDEPYQVHLTSMVNPLTTNESNDPMVPSIFDEHLNGNPSMINLAEHKLLPEQKVEENFDIGLPGSTNVPSIIEEKFNKSKLIDVKLLENESLIVQKTDEANFLNSPSNSVVNKPLTRPDELPSVQIDKDVSVTRTTTIKNLLITSESVCTENKINFGLHNKPLPKSEEMNKAQSQPYLVNLPSNLEKLKKTQTLISPIIPKVELANVPSVLEEHFSNSLINLEIASKPSSTKKPAAVKLASDKLVPIPYKTDVVKPSSLTEVNKSPTLNMENQPTATEDAFVKSFLTMLEEYVNEDILTIDKPIKQYEHEGNPDMNSEKHSSIVQSSKKKDSSKQQLFSDKSSSPLEELHLNTFQSNSEADFDKTISTTDSVDIDQNIEANEKLLDKPAVFLKQPILTSQKPHNIYNSLSPVTHKWLNIPSRKPENTLENPLKFLEDDVDVPSFTDGLNKTILNQELSNRLSTLQCESTVITSSNATSLQDTASMHAEESPPIPHIISDKIDLNEFIKNPKDLISTTPINQLTVSIKKSFSKNPIATPAYEYKLDKSSSNSKDIDNLSANEELLDKTMSITQTVTTEEPSVTQHSLDFTKLPEHHNQFLKKTLSTSEKLWEELSPTTSEDILNNDTITNENVLNKLKNIFSYFTFSHQKLLNKKQPADKEFLNRLRKIQLIIDLLQKSEDLVNISTVTMTTQKQQKMDTFTINYEQLLEKPVPQEKEIGPKPYAKTNSFVERFTISPGTGKPQLLKSKSYFNIVPKLETLNKPKIWQAQPSKEPFLISNSTFSKYKIKMKSKPMLNQLTPPRQGFIYRQHEISEQDRRVNMPPRIRPVEFLSEEYTSESDELNTEISITIKDSLNKSLTKSDEINLIKIPLMTTKFMFKPASKIIKFNDMESQLETTESEEVVTEITHAKGSFRKPEQTYVIKFPFKAPTENFINVSPRLTVFVTKKSPTKPEEVSEETLTVIESLYETSTIPDEKFFIKFPIKPTGFLFQPTKTKALVDNKSSRYKSVVSSSKKITIESEEFESEISITTDDVDIQNSFTRPDETALQVEVYFTTTISPTKGLIMLSRNRPVIEPSTEELMTEPVEVVIEVPTMTDRTLNDSSPHDDTTFATFPVQMKEHYNKNILTNKYLSNLFTTKEYKKLYTNPYLFGVLRSKFSNNSLGKFINKSNTIQIEDYLNRTTSTNESTKITTPDKTYLTKFPLKSKEFLSIPKPAKELLNKSVPSQTDELLYKSIISTKGFLDKFAKQDDAYSIKEIDEFFKKPTPTSKDPLIKTNEQSFRKFLPTNKILNGYLKKSKTVEIPKETTITKTLNKLLMFNKLQHPRNNLQNLKELDDVNEESGGTPKPGKSYKASKPLRIPFNSTCGIDKSMSKTVSEGIAYIDEYPWLGILYYPYRKKMLITSVVLVTKDIVIGTAMDINKLPKIDFRHRSKVILGHNCSGPRINVLEYSYHPDHRRSAGALVIVQLDLYLVEQELRPICGPPPVLTESSLYAMILPDECKSSKIRIYEMQYVEPVECKRFYRRSGLNIGDNLWPRHGACGRAKYGEQCVWRSGAALVVKQGFRWHLLGFGVNGPGCSAPARFVDYGKYQQWVTDTVARIGRPAITRLAPNHLIMRRSQSHIQRFGPCDTGEMKQELFTDNTVIEPEKDKFRPVIAKYNMTLLTNVDYSCITFRANYNPKLAYAQRPLITLKRYCLTPMPNCYDTGLLQIDFYIQIKFVDTISYKMSAYGQEFKVIDSRAAMKYANENQRFPRIPWYPIIER